MAEPSKTIVLKFGGSVLLDEFRLQRAVHEVYRWRREAYRVVAVVSALSGRPKHSLSRAERSPGMHHRTRRAP